MEWEVFFSVREKGITDHCQDTWEKQVSNIEIYQKATIKVASHFLYLSHVGSCFPALLMHLLEFVLNVNFE